MPGGRPRSFNSFTCSNCRALYHPVKVEAGPETNDHELNPAAVHFPAGKESSFSVLPLEKGESDSAAGLAIFLQFLFGLARHHPCRGGRRHMGARFHVNGFGRIASIRTRKTPISTPIGVESVCKCWLWLCQPLRWSIAMDESVMPETPWSQELIDYLMTCISNVAECADLSDDERYADGAPVSEVRTEFGTWFRTVPSHGAGVVRRTAA
jgi:hypothetical protein